MNDQIVLSPELDLTPAEFVEAWNDSPEYAQLARIHLSSSAPSRSSAHGFFTDPAILNTIISLASTVGIGIATNAIYDVLKQALSKKGVKKHTKITTLDQPDGTHLFIVETEE